MLPVLGRRQINDDGVSEMSVSTRDDKQKLRLHNREPDEISVVSSLHDDDNGKGELDNNDSAEERVDSPMRGAQR